MRSARANSQNSPAMTSATPTAAEPMILDPPDLRIVIGGQPVGKLLDRGIEQFNDHHQRHRADQLDAAHQRHADQPRRGQRQHQRDQLLANGLLRTDGKDQAVTRLMVARQNRKQFRIPRPPAPA